MKRALIHAALASPAVLLALAWQYGQLGVDPEKTLIWETGIWTFNLLILVVLMPRIARWADWPAVIGCRRAVGLWAFAYATTHLGFFVIFLLGWDMARLGSEIVDRPYILVGFNAWLVLVLMAATSTRGWVRRLGKRWKRLHGLIYAALALAAVHYLLMIRSDWGWPVAYASIALLLVGLRVLKRRRFSPATADRAA
ncbi:MAG: protein-methionine-sulfoxide reductase heme-binding subunit MsrQ [Pseudomonadota bacterium]|nr:MAG: protein-methionine-sulfoxide reductase heme-binding subunit MsrQ [Pseudomonadota bacterium]